MEPVKTSDNVWSGIAWCLTVALIGSVIFAVAGRVFVEWMEFILYGSANPLLKMVILAFPMIGIPLVITYLLDREGLIW